MNIKLARQATRLFPRRPDVNRKVTKALRKKWMLSISYLGDKWLLAHPIPRKTA